MSVPFESRVSSSVLWTLRIVVLTSIVALKLCARRIAQRCAIECSMTFRADGSRSLSEDNHIDEHNYRIRHAKTNDDFHVVHPEFVLLSRHCVFVRELLVFGPLIRVNLTDMERTRTASIERAMTVLTPGFWRFIIEYCSLWGEDTGSHTYGGGVNGWVTTHMLVIV